MSKKILGLDLGSNSLGWALLEQKDGEVCKFIDIGSRIFTKAVEEKVPTPKNVKRRDMRLGRRVLQRRARRKQRMLNYLVSLELLPKELKGNFEPEIILNNIGNPYQLRAEALDRKLDPFELGRILLHLVARRGFLSTKNQAAGDLIDDPDTTAYLEALDKEPSKDKEEGAFKSDISELRQQIKDKEYRTLGEYLYKETQQNNISAKRNRIHEGGHLRTDRQMYRDELDKIWAKQKQYFKNLPEDFMQENKGIKQIIFYQRPLKLKKDRVGKCALEPKKYRAPKARLEVQRFRYLQDVNNLKYFERQTDKWVALDHEKRKSLIEYFEQNSRATITALKKLFGLDKTYKFNLETKDLKGNITACEIRDVVGELWDSLPDYQQVALVEDLLTIKKKSILKKRLINHWGFTTEQAVKLCLIEFEPGHSNHSLKAIRKLLPHLKQGCLYSSNSDDKQKGALQQAYPNIGESVSQIKNYLGSPQGTSNPIVNRGMHELRRVVNAIIQQYGKPDVVRIEMARDLEMNTKRYKENQFRQEKNKKANEKAVDAYKSLNLGKYPSYDDRIKYRLWEEQDRLCAYSCKPIPLNAVFTAKVEIDHILPYKKSLDDSYMNKVLCYAAENRFKSDRTPKDTWGDNDERWTQITQAIKSWKNLTSKVNRFYKIEKDLQDRDFISTQLNDTRYISRLAIEFIKELGCDVTTSKGATTAWLRHQWGLNNLIGETEKKERTDHRHHAIDAAVVACVDMSLYKKILNWTKNNEKEIKISEPYFGFRDELEARLKHIIIAHAVHRKLSGSLHEETGTGYIEKHGGLVYRKNLMPNFTVKNVNSIVDETVKKIVLAHLEKFDGNPKKAFADGEFVYHKDSITPIKRVRVLQSKTTLKKIEESKFGVKDKSGKVFKWMSYGNMHHVEIIQNKKTGKYKGIFVTMMEAHRRGMTGTRTAQERGVRRENVILTDHGDKGDFIMALHINDLVSVDAGKNKRVFYRVQVLDRDGGRLELRLHTAATLKNKNEHIRKSISAIMSMGLRKHKINSIGVFLDD